MKIDDDTVLTVDAFTSFREYAEENRRTKERFILIPPNLVFSMEAELIKLKKIKEILGVKDEE